MHVDVHIESRQRIMSSAAGNLCTIQLALAPAGSRVATSAPLAGKHETSSMHDFSWGVANRGASIRVGRSVPVDKCGYYEDRRPASNLDPYTVCKLLVETTLLS